MSKLSNESIVPSNGFDSVEKHLVFLKHLAEYDFAKEYVKDKAVLEVGCGTGYGAHYVSKYAREAVAVDISNDAIQYSRSQYDEKNLCFKELSGSELPFDDSSFDTVLSFHVIEHLEKNTVTQWLSEINRVLKDEGVFIVSTPNKKLRLLPLQKPWNVEHKTEYSCGELTKLLNGIFADVEIYGLSANEEIRTIERDRVRQKPAHVYILRPLSRVLSHLPLPVRTNSANIRTTLVNQKKENHLSLSDHSKMMSVNDFFIVDPTSSREQSIDFIGICKKARNA